MIYKQQQNKSENKQINKYKCRLYNNNSNNDENIFWF